MKKEELIEFKNTIQEELHGDNGGGKTSPKPVSKPKRPNIFKRFWKWLFG